VYEAREIKKYSHYQQEDEVLLLPCTFLQVNGIAKLSGDITMVQLSQVEAPFPLLGHFDVFSFSVFLLLFSILDLFILFFISNINFVE
jgi:hypothetical protein